MSRQQMEKAISEAPNGALASSVSQLLEVGGQLQDDILGILPTIKGDLIVTPSRIISVNQSGEVGVWSYADVKGIRFNEGKKKLFGGRELMYLHIYLLDGNMVNCQLPSRVAYEYLNRVGKLAENACKKAHIANL